MLDNKNEKTDLKIQIQQNIINELEEEISRLKLENDDLQKELLVERNKPKLGYERAKHLMTSLEEKKDEYQKLIYELKELKTSYIDKINNVEEIRVELKSVLDILR